MTAALTATVAGAGLVHPAARTLFDHMGVTGKKDTAAPRRPRSAAPAALTDTPPPPDTTELSALLPGISLRRVPSYARMALLAALRAMEDAGWRAAPTPRRPMALVLGTAYSGISMNMDFMDSLLDNGPRLASPTAFSHAVNNMGAGLLSLLLHIQGPCFTLSQFELSFAAALTTAVTLLHTHRADRVLVGAVDEADPRFTHCCPQVTHPNLPPAVGAVFLCLTREAAPGTSVQVRWGNTVSHAPTAPLPQSVATHSEQQSYAASPDATDARHFVSGAAPPLPGEENNAALYGYGPLAQALDTALALRLLRMGTCARVFCRCAALSHRPYNPIQLAARSSSADDNHRIRQAAIELWRQS